MAAIATTALGQGHITTDPTRPPIGFAADMPDDAAAGSQLQTVMIAPNRNAAIINGVVVKVGDKYGDAVLERVAEDRVVLRSGSSRQELRLHPAVEKVGVARAVPVPSPVEKSAPRKAEAKATPKAQAKPKAAAQQGAKPTADRSTGAR